MHVCQFDSIQMIVVPEAVLGCSFTSSNEATSLTTFLRSVAVGQLVSESESESEKFD